MRVCLYQLLLMCSQNIQRTASSLLFIWQSTDNVIRNHDSRSLIPTVAPGNGLCVVNAEEMQAQLLDVIGQNWRF